MCAAQLSASQKSVELPKAVFLAESSGGERLFYSNEERAWRCKADETKTCSEKPSKATLQLSGNWLKEKKRPISKRKFLPSGLQELLIDGKEIVDWDSSLLVFIRMLQKKCRDNSISLQINEFPAGAVKLLESSSAALHSTDPKSTIAEELLLIKIADKSRAIVQITLKILFFIGEFSKALWRFFLGKARFQWKDIILQLSKAGPAALAIISLIGFLMGLILAFIGAIPLKLFAAEAYVASLLGIGIFRLLAPVMVGVVMAGRTGAAFAAELGSMQSNEEIDAFLTLGIPPMEFLVLPRSLALTFMMPVLCVFADILGILGGMIVAVYYLNLSSLEFYQTLVSTTRLADFLVGLFTTLIFGILVSACGCYQGIYCGRNAEAVGKATTAAVVSSIVCIVIATAVITVVTVVLGI